MINVALSAEDLTRPLPFYLAMEEWVGRNLPPDEYFFTWRVQPTVICGRNQELRQEIDLDFCAEHGIQVCRRKSGGGCVFADLNNLMLSYISPSADVQTTFARYTGMVVSLLKELNFDAEATGRNDILVNGRKVSGNAFYFLRPTPKSAQRGNMIGGRSIVHGTMLIKVNEEMLAGALKPSASKLFSHKVKSVESRVISLSDLDPLMSPQLLNRFLVNTLTEQKIVLTDSNIAEIHEIEKAYYTPRWLEGIMATPAAASGSRRVKTHHRIDGVGEFEMLVEDVGGVINDVNIVGDFFLLSDLDSLLLNYVKGATRTPYDLRNALCDVDVSKTIAGLSNDQFIEMLLTEEQNTNT